MIKNKDNYFSWGSFSIALASVLGVFFLTYFSSQTLMNSYAQDLSLRVKMRGMSQIRLFSAIMAEKAQRLAAGKMDSTEREKVFQQIFEAYDAAYAQIDSVFGPEQQSDLRAKLESISTLVDNWQEGILDSKQIAELISEIQELTREAAGSESELWKKLAANYSFLTVWDEKQSLYFYIFAAIILGCFISTFVLIRQKALALHRLNLAQDELKKEKVRRIQLAKMTTLGEMAAGIAHEINNPLMIMMAATSKIKKRLHELNISDSEAEKSSEKIAEMSDRINKIVKGLLYFSRDGQKDPMQVTSIEKVIKDSLGLIEEKIRWHKIDLQIEVNESSGKIYCRPWEVSQILVNLINNAIDAMENKSEKKLLIRAEQKASKVLVQVKDSGGGVSPEIYEKIFQPFFTTKDVGKGVGLGLSIAKGIAEDHQATLSLKNSQEGAEFNLEFQSSYAETNLSRARAKSENVIVN